MTIYVSDERLACELCECEIVTIDRSHAYVAHRRGESGRFGYWVRTDDPNERAPRLAEDCECRCHEAVRILERFPGSF